MHTANKKYVSSSEFTHKMIKTKYVSPDGIISSNNEKEKNNVRYTLFVDRPLVYLYTRNIKTPIEEEIDVYGVYSVKPNSKGKYDFLYSFVLDKDYVEKIKDFKKILI